MAHASGFRLRLHSAVSQIRRRSWKSLLAALVLATLLVWVVIPHNTPAQTGYTFLYTTYYQSFMYPETFDNFVRSNRSLRADLLARCMPRSNRGR